MFIGYARVSTQDQHLDLQREALIKAGCQKIFEDKTSGNRAERPGLATALEMLRERPPWAAAVFRVDVAGALGLAAGSEVLAV